MNTDLNRRDLFKSLGAVALGSATLQLTAGEPNAPLFFGKPDFQLLDTLTEIIIPTDSHSPGARAAGVATYIDSFVARSIDPEEKTSWTKGLALVNSLSQQMNQTSFNDAKPDQQVKVLKSIAVNEEHPATDAEKFWGQLKETTAFVYYTSSIGIHEDMNYKGNVPLEQFVGFDAT
jgi:Gluconate 2-dehydrogenase subunit 3